MGEWPPSLTVPPNQSAVLKSAATAGIQALTDSPPANVANCVHWNQQNPQRDSNCELLVFNIYTRDGPLIPQKAAVVAGFFIPIKQ